MFGLFLVCLASTFATFQDNLTPYNLPDTTVILELDNEPNYIKLTAEKGSLSYTKTTSNEFSKVSVKGTDCPLKIKSGKEISVYFRIKSDVIQAQFSMFQMTVAKNKRIANSNSMTNKKIQKVPQNITQIDPVKKVYHMRIPTLLPPDIYGLAYVSIDYNGHARYNNFYCKSVYCIEITE